MRVPILHKYAGTIQGNKELRNYEVRCPPFNNIVHVASLYILHAWLQAQLVLYPSKKLVRKDIWASEVPLSQITNTSL